MPAPSFRFDDLASGLPRQPVPIRFVCLAADWTPSVLAEVVGGFNQGFPPILTVYEFNPTSAAIGEVHPDRYAKFRTASGPLSTVLADLPANHFVWSDDLVIAFSDFIDLTSDRITAREQGHKIRWNPALSDSAAIINSSTD